jgi:thioredoxin-like negative regulator of GroEL
VPAAPVLLGDDAAEPDSHARPALIGFWADWCVPSRGLAADLAAVAERFGERLSVSLVDIDRARGLRRRFAIGGLPTLVLVREGSVSLRRVGLLTRPALMRLLEQQLGVNP